MDKPFSQLRGDLPKIKKDIEAKVEELQRWTALKIFRGIIAGNPRHPVDTGYSRANWNMSLGQPNPAVLPKPDNKRRIAAPVIASLQNPKLETVWIVNGVDYVKFLEAGHSKQAPSGFVRINVERVKNELEAKLKKK